MAAALAQRLGMSPDHLEVRAMAAAVAAALWVAVEEWQAVEGQVELGPLFDRTLGTVLAGEHATYGANEAP
jgi:hypothetical protein